MSRCAVYARFSSENQKESSITDQFRVCEDYCKRQDGWRIVTRYEDKAISGATDQREAYQQMLKDAQAGLFEVLLVHDLSRLSRDFVEAEQARRRLVHWNVRLIGATDGIDTNQEGHELLSNVKGAFNQQFLRDLAKHTRKGMVRQVLAGFIGGGRCFGYRLTPQYDPSRKDPYGQPLKIGTRLEKNSEQAKWVAWIFERYAEGWSPFRIVEELNRRHVPPPGVHFKRRTSRPPSWCASALVGDVKLQTGLLNNRLYAGLYCWGRNRWVKDPDHKKKKSKRLAVPEPAWIKVPAEHLRIVSEELWHAVKDRQADVTKRYGFIRTSLRKSPAGRGPKCLFSSLLRCGQCGNNYIIVDRTVTAVPAGAIAASRSATTPSWRQADRDAPAPGHSGGSVHARRLRGLQGRGA